MKILYSYFVASITLVAVNAFAQPRMNTPKINIVKSNPFTFFWGSMPFTSEQRIVFEFEIGKKQTLMLSLSRYSETPFLKWNESPKGVPNENWHIGGFRFQAMKKYYFGKKAFKAQGKYSGFIFSHSEIKYAPYQYYLKGTYLGGINTYLCWIVGKQKKWFDTITYDIYCGVGVKNSSWDIYQWNGKTTPFDFGGDLERILLSRLKTCAGLNIGYAF